MTEDQLQDFRHSLDIGRGGMWLKLTEEQYRKMK